MVATDVASRGIGMIDHNTALSFPSPFPSSFTLSGNWPCSIICHHPLSLGHLQIQVQARSFYFWFSYWRILDIKCSVARYTFSFRLTTYQRGTEADWDFLDSFKLHFPGFSRTVASCHALDQDVRMLLPCRELCRKMNALQLSHDQ